MGVKLGESEIKMLLWLDFSAGFVKEFLLNTTDTMSQNLPLEV